MGKWLSVDPGETVGWALWEDEKLLRAEQTPLWEFGNNVFEAVFGDSMAHHMLAVEPNPEVELFKGIERIVCEDFRIYPWEAHRGGLDWDEVRTARLIGALDLICQQARLEFVLQPAKIKERAEAAGAEVLFNKPLHPNRHGNDAIRHGVYYMAVKRGAAPLVIDG